jgi:protein SCO1/2
VQKKAIGIVLAGIVVLIAGLPVAYLSWPARTPVLPPTEQSSIGGAFSLRDATGRAVSDETFRGRWMLVFFGFTYCPDACPTALADVAGILQRLGHSATQVQPLFVTIDPTRDTPEVLSQYTTYFDKRILGLTGTPEQIDAMTSAYGVRVEKVLTGESYMFDHSTYFYLIDPEGRFEDYFSARDDRDRIAEQIARRIEAGS